MPRIITRSIGAVRAFISFGCHSVAMLYTPHCSVHYVPFQNTHFGKPFFIQPYWHKIPKSVIYLMHTSSKSLLCARFFQTHLCKHHSSPILWAVPTKLAFCCELHDDICESFTVTGSPTSSLSVAECVQATHDFTDDERVFQMRFAVSSASFREMFFQLSLHT